MTDSKPLVGMGACLAGQAVRYDGSSKSPHPELQRLLPLFHIKPFCPEAGIGLGVPRPPIELVTMTDGALHLRDVATHQRDITAQMRRYSADVIQQHPDLCGYIGVAKSPSCGAHKVKRHDNHGTLLARDSQGLHIETLTRQNTLLPVTDDIRLSDTAVRDSFIACVHFYHDAKAVMHCPSTSALQALYRRYKYLVMAHSPKLYQRLGKWLANCAANEANAQQFTADMLAALGTPATRKNHANALCHMAGYFKQLADTHERQALNDAINHYRMGIATRKSVCGHINDLLARYPQSYVNEQRYLDLSV